MAERSLATVLFTDIVGSTERAAELRDAGWREMRSEHDRQVRRALRQFGGREISTAGDSFLATFDRPAAAIACADAIRSRIRELGLEVRAGLHMGEIERVGRDVGGLGVNIGARVAAEAGPVAAGAPGRRSAQAGRVPVAREPGRSVPSVHR